MQQFKKHNYTKVRKVVVYFAPKNEQNGTSDRDRKH